MSQNFPNRISLLLLLCLCIPSVESVRLSFSGNATLADKDDYQYRPLTIKEWGPSPPSSAWGAVLQSKSLRPISEVLGRDLIVSVPYIVPTEAPPTAFLSYFATEKDFKDYNISDYSTVDITNAAGFIAIEFLELVELDDNDEVVKNVSLSSLFWIRSSIARNKEGLYYITMTGTGGTSSNFKVELTFLASNRVGRLNLHDTIITPLNLECIIRINNFPYVDADNGRIRMTLLIASKEDETHDAVGQQRIEAGEKYKHVYALISKKGYVGKDDADLSLGDWKKGLDYSVLQNTVLEQQLTRKFAQTGKVTSMDVTFPAGGSDIIMDPIILGTRKIPHIHGKVKGMRKDVLITIIIAVIVALILAIALIAVMVYRYRRRQNYQRV